MIVDSHVHIGNSEWGNFSPEYLLEIIRDVDCAICSNLNGIDSAGCFKDEYECNLEMLEISKKYPKLKPLAVCQPNITENNKVVRTLLETYPDFIGLKIHPEYMRLPADSEKYDKYLELAREFNKPCLYHSGHIKSKYSSPLLIYEKAKQFPELPVILGHLSTGPKESHKTAIDIMLESIEQETATIYADVSWVDIDDIILLIESLKNTKKGDYTHRIMWASDAPVGDFNQKKNLYDKNLNLFKVKILEHFKDEELLNNLLCNNARKLFNF